MSNDPDVSRRLAELEGRLDAYHEQLEAALEHDRQFQLGATWGVVNSVLCLAAILAILVTGKPLLTGATWLWLAAASAIYVIGSIILIGLIASWVDKRRIADAQQLSRLPNWQAKQ